MRFLAALIVFFSFNLAQAVWDTETDLGYVSQSGNAEQNNAILRTKLTKESGKNAYTVNGEYINSSGENAAGENTRLAESISAGLKYTRSVHERLGLFGGALYEKNRFLGFEQRYSGDFGFKYNIVKKEDKSFYLLNETGYRYRSQFEYLPGPGQGDETVSNFARVYFETGKKLNKTSNLKFWVENLIDFEDSENFEVSFEPSIDVEIGEFFSKEKPARVSMKFSYKGMFDNVPATPTAVRYDSIVSTGLKVVY